MFLRRRMQVTVSGLDQFGNSLHEKTYVYQFTLLGKLFNFLFRKKYREIAGCLYIEDTN